ncbi:protein MON2 homolog isoform X2 [Amborella trichopoda]|uniref:Protein MON2 homolog n=1 Tax=Amborella trichopoda TaxID=13333 RepID=W1NEB4_AMBTC|nr:protein MON2 homolog isoform X2 [Amborella trichopoda]ERM93505.1 hypothetical protein AMTR_s00004p00038450 [Amborella trichopoda]|eukprot:XP_020518922.1 protein MON2 homolog isoform X2 [Amborella trichopoda]
MAFMAVLESDLRALSAEARRKYPAVKDGAEHAILKLRTLSNPGEIAQNEDILQIFLKACKVKTVKLSVIGLSCLQKLISHDAASPSALKEILSTLKDHAEMADESVQLKTLQTILIIFQSRLHPQDEDDMAQALGIILSLLENSRSPDSVHSTAAATFRQAVALIFDNVIREESLPAGIAGYGNHLSRTRSVSGDVSRSINHTTLFEGYTVSGVPSARENLTDAGKLGLHLLEDLTALAAGGSVIRLRVIAVQRTFTLDILEFVLSNYVSVFRVLLPYEQVLRHQICSLLMTSLRANTELEGEAGEPSFRRLVLRSVAHVIRLYSSSLITECEVFLNMLVKITALDLPLWHRILVLEVLRGFCVEARTLRLLYQNFDMQPKNSSVVASIVESLARVVSNIQVPDSSEESLAAVAGMFSSKAKGVEWSLETDAPNAAVVVASEAHGITLAVEGLLGVVFTVATLTDEAVDIGELESPRCESDPRGKCIGNTAVLCLSMVDSLWMTILNALSLILTRSQGEAIVLEILKGYQAFTQACGVLRAVDPLNCFLASLCKFTISTPGEQDKKSVMLSPGSKRPEHVVEQRDNIVLTPKNVQALRTLFNIAHRLHNVLGSSWVLVLETLAALDRVIHSPHATTQEVSATVPRLTREMSGQYSDFNILSSLNSKLFESSAIMDTFAVKSLLSALRMLSNQCMRGSLSSFGQSPGSNSGGYLPPGSSQQIGCITFSVERMLAILNNNLHRVEPLWDHIVGHLLELADVAKSHVQSIALDALDQSICVVLGSERFQSGDLSRQQLDKTVTIDTELRTFEWDVISPLKVLYMSSQILDVRAGALRILLHVLERHGEKLYCSWPGILEILRSVVDASEKDLIPLGFQSVRVVMNDGLSTMPTDCLDICMEVTGAYSAQKSDINISLTAISLLWTATDFIARGLSCLPTEDREAGGPPIVELQLAQKEHETLGEQRNGGQTITTTDELPERDSLMVNKIDCDRLLFLVFSMLQKLGADERPEVRNSAIRTLFQILSSHGQKLSRVKWEDCLWKYVFPIVDSVAHLAASSSRDEWQGQELGIRGGKAVHMLIHHSRNTAQKQWDETIVLVFNGISRLLRTFFPFLQSLSKFWIGWESLILFVRSSIAGGSKEVALAAINCLQTTVLSHCSKGNLPMPYFKSVFDVYELVLQMSLNCENTIPSKVKQEILHSLGDLYVQAQIMFDNDMYLQLLHILHLAISISDSMEADSGNIPAVQRTMLEVLPALHPNERLSPMWSHLLRQLLCYLPGSEASLPVKAKGNEQAGSILCSSGNQHESSILETHNAKDLRTALNGSPKAEKFDSSIVASGISCKISKMQVSPSSAPMTYDSTASNSNHLFGEKLIPVLVDLFLLAPRVEKWKAFPEVIQSLGRCMATRRDTADGSLWRLAVEGFNRVLVDDVNSLHFDHKIDPSISKPMRTRCWKEVADVYEIFLVGSCGRALPSDVLSYPTLRADETLETTVLNVLCDQILKSSVDAPNEILQRLISTLDRCASRTVCLPVESVGLLPFHCSRFSLACLQKIFSLCSCDPGTDWHSTRTEVGKCAITVLMNRCEFMLQRFLIDENVLGEAPVPSVRVVEVVFVLQELARLVIHPAMASVLPLPAYVRERASQDKDREGCAHLLVIFPSLCELVVSREARVRELVQVLLRLITRELGLQKLNLSG